MGKGVPFRSHAECQCRSAIFINIWCTASELLFLAYVNDIWRNILPTIRLFADDCVMCRKIIKKISILKI